MFLFSGMGTKTERCVILAHLLRYTPKTGAAERIALPLKRWQGIPSRQRFRGELKIGGRYGKMAQVLVQISRNLLFSQRLICGRGYEFNAFGQPVVVAIAYG
jgi:hypothetical protein